MASPKKKMDLVSLKKKDGFGISKKYGFGIITKLSTNVLYVAPISVVKKRIDKKKDPFREPGLVVTIALRTGRPVEMITIAKAIYMVPSRIEH